MSIYEYDEVKYLRTLQEESREDGRKEGKEQLIDPISGIIFVYI